MLLTLLSLPNLLLPPATNCNPKLQIFKEYPNIKKPFAVFYHVPAFKSPLSTGLPQAFPNLVQGWCTAVYILKLSRVLLRLGSLDD